MQLSVDIILEKTFSGGVRFRRFSRGASQPQYGIIVSE